ncbi:MAG: TfoX/Sxy family protein [Pseudomonadota bacterium]
MTKLSDFEAHIADLLAPVGPVKFRRMFGGSGVYAGDRMFGLIASDTLYLKTDAHSVDAFEAAGSDPFTFEAKGRKPIRMSYWRIPDDALDDGDAFCKWACLAIEAARRAPSKKT